MSNSKLVDVVIKSPHNGGKKTHIIDTITPHCVVGQATAEGIGNCFTGTRVASCNYGIGTEGRIVLCVDEDKVSYCSSDSQGYTSNDNRAVTIECASDSFYPYKMNSKVYNKLVKLCVDICKRNNIKKLLFLGDKQKTLSYTPKKGEAVLTAHRWFSSKECPGDWLYSRYGELAKEVTSKLSGSKKESSNTSKKTYKNGDVIKLKDGATYYDGKKIPSWVFKSTLYYRGKNSNGVIFSTQKTGAVTGVVKESSIK